MDKFSSSVSSFFFQSRLLDAHALLSCAYSRSHDVHMHVIYKSILKLHFGESVAPFLSLSLSRVKTWISLAVKP